ncbi:MAG: YggU family protein [Lentisphaeria bacterium]|nr:YggU family protein [Lentisphaeria bacterium]
MTRDELFQAVQVQNGGISVSCHVQPNASRTAVTGMYGSELKISLKTPPVDGKANKELCRYFSELFDLPGSSVKLLSGPASRRKRIWIPLDPETFLRKFST